MAPAQCLSGENICPKIDTNSSSDPTATDSEPV